MRRNLQKLQYLTRIEFKVIIYKDYMWCEKYENSFGSMTTSSSSSHTQVSCVDPSIAVATPTTAIAEERVIDHLCIILFVAVFQDLFLQKVLNYLINDRYH